MFESNDWHPNRSQRNADGLLVKLETDFPKWKSITPLLSLCLKYNPAERKALPDIDLEALVKIQHAENHDWRWESGIRALCDPEEAPPISSRPGCTLL